VILLEDVFGVSAKPVLSYIERPDVDERFLEALVSDKEIIVYGSSKQGKTALVSKYLPYDKHFLVSLTPKMSVLDIYQIVLNKAGVRIITSTTERSGTETAAGVGARVKAVIPLFGGGEASASGSVKADSGTAQSFEEVPVNLELPQQVADLLNRVGSDKWIILENFHYLNDEAQQQLAFDLRAFQELGVRFVVLGVWREKNRLTQFNGDLLDRIFETPVEPWVKGDFRRVVEKGSEQLNIRIAEPLVARAIESSFASIGVFQELLKGLVANAGVESSSSTRVEIDDMQHLTKAIAQKASDYASRHQRALEAIAAGHLGSGGPKNDKTPLYLPYYLVRVILEGGYEAIAGGMRRAELHERIRRIHHRAGEDVRASDISNLLYGLGNLQASKRISPPVIDFDKHENRLQVVDSTFYFFIKNADLAEILREIESPLQA
jgi:hypothetical protein